MFSWVSVTIATRLPEGELVLSFLGSGAVGRAAAPAALAATIPAAPAAPASMKFRRSIPFSFFSFVSESMTRFSC